MRKLEVIGLILLGLLIQPAAAMAQDFRAIDLFLPDSATRSQPVQLRIVARLARGARLRVTTESGQILGVVASGQEVTNDPTQVRLSVPQSALKNDRLTIRLQVIAVGAPPRPPRPDEVETVELVSRSGR